MGHQLHLQTFRILNYRRLKNVCVDLEDETTIFVGANNSGKTSATHVFQAFLGSSGERFAIHDFSADCWPVFDQIGDGVCDESSLPKIVLDLWFKVNDVDLHRVIGILPGLDWKDAPVGVRLEFAPKNGAELLTNFHEAKNRASKHASPSVGDRPGYHPWPETLTDYLTRCLLDEYKIFYYVLDHEGFDESYCQSPDYNPSELASSGQSGAKLLSSLLRVDFLTAQRHLSDSESRGRAEDLSRRLSRFYERNLEKHDEDFKAVAALANSEAQLNEHLQTVFAPTLKSLNTLGYPGLADPYLVIKSAFNPESILATSASVHYALTDPDASPPGGNALTLPDRYNGLGFKNLIFMVLEVLDFHERWASLEENRPPLHLVVVEEPEAHLHTQLQQVFIRKIRELIPEESPDFTSQLVVTTHSPHITYESNFKPIRYFRRREQGSGEAFSDVLNLSHFYTKEEECRKFLLKYMKLTHCDLFFADATVLVEGNVERLLLPLMIEKCAPKLQSQYLSILEVGGAFAHLFKTLIQFLGIPALVITDLDSVSPPATDAARNDCESPLEGSAGKKEAESDEDDDEGSQNFGSACMTSTPGALTSNETLRQWLPKLTSIDELLSASPSLKTTKPTPEEPAKVCVAYQTTQCVKWNGSESDVAGRTFEEAFALENIQFCQELDHRPLGLRVITKTEPTPKIDVVIEKIYKRVKSDSFDKTRFALALITMDESKWTVPSYIKEGLAWLEEAVTGIRRESAVEPLSPDDSEAEE